MIRCADTETLMSLALDGMLDEAGRQKLDAHLAECPECAQVWEAMNQASALLWQSGMLEAPAGFVENVLVKLEARRRRRRRWLQVVTLLTGSTLVWMTVGLLAGAGLMALWTFVPGVREGTVSLFGSGTEAIAILYNALTTPLRMLERGASAALVAGFCVFAILATSTWTWLLLHINRRAQVPATRRSR